jgi:hypothetical protein
MAPAEILIYDGDRCEVVADENLTYVNAPLLPSYTSKVGAR